MKREAFIQASTRVRIEEKGLLTKEQLHRLTEVGSVDELNRILAETSYQQEVAKMDRPEDYEQMLDAELRELYRFLYEVSPEPKLIDVFAARYTFHNLKVLAKEILQETDLSAIYVPLGDLPTDALKEAHEAGTLHRVPVYGEMLSALLNDFSDKKEPGRIDVLADKFYAQRLAELAEEAELELVDTYAKDAVDLYNLSMLFRLKKMEAPVEMFQEAVLTGGRIYQPQLISRYFDTVDAIAGSLYGQPIGDTVREGINRYEETGSLSSFEQAQENHFMRMAQNAKMISYGPEVLVSYLISKETEIKNLRILYVSKRNHMSQEFTRERLRLTYV